MVFFSFLLFLGRVYHAKDACEPATGVSDMIPGALRSKSMVRSRELTDEGPNMYTYKYGVATPGSRTIAGSPLLAVLILFLFRLCVPDSLPACPCASLMKHPEGQGTLHDALECCLSPMVSPTVISACLVSLVSLPNCVFIEKNPFYSRHDVCSSANKWISAGARSIWSRVHALMLIHVLSQRSTTTPLASKRDMVLMGLLTRQLAETFLEPAGTSSVHASGFQPVSGASVRRCSG